MEMSSRGLAFVVRHEGFVARAYRDPVGIVTIGTGFTNGSKVAVRMLGKIKMGMTITREQNDRVLRQAFREEYGPPVLAAMPAKARPYQHEAGGSYCFNCGPGAMEDKWVGLFHAGHLGAAAARLRVSRITAKKVPLRGLKNRRAAEANLLEHGDYGDGKGFPAPSRDPARSQQEPKPAQPDEDLKAWQQKLTDLGYYAGRIDGWHGPMVTAAVKTFQKAHPHLTDDGILGPATMATIERAIAARKQAAGATIVGGAGATVGVTLINSGVSWGLWAGLGLAALALIGAGVMAWRYRDEIRQHFAKEKTS